MKTPWQTLLENHELDKIKLVKHYLTKCQGNISFAADELGIDRRGLERFIAKHSIPVNRTANFWRARRLNQMVRESEQLIEESKHAVIRSEDDNWTTPHVSDGEPSRLLFERLRGHDLSKPFKDHSK